MTTLLTYYLLLRRLINRNYPLSAGDLLLVRDVCRHPARLQDKRGVYWKVCTLCDLALPQKAVLIDLVRHIERGRGDNGE